MNLSDASRKIIIIMVIISVGACIAGCFFITGKLVFIGGAVVGILFSALKIIMMDKSMKKAIEMPKDKVSNYLQLQMVLRYLITGVVIIGSVLIDPDMMYGTLCGILALQIASYMAHFAIKPNVKKP